MLNRKIFCKSGPWYLRRRVVVAALRDPPLVERVQPPHGPAAGNTPITVSGNRLNRAELRYVHYGDKYQSKVDDPR